MNNTKNLMAAAIITCSLVGVTFAATATNLAPPNPQNQGKMMRLYHPHKSHHGNFMKYRKNFSMSWHRALKRSKPLTEAQASTVAKAAVILYGDSTMNVGSVTPIQGKRGFTNYKVSITNSQGKVLNTVLMNGVNGRIIKLVK